MRIFFAAIVLLPMFALFNFVFNPMGLGPEKEAVLTPEFFSSPARKLSGLELLTDGREAFQEIFAAIDAAESSIYIQTFIWKDDNTGRTVADKLKAAAGRGVEVVVRKDMLGTFFELGDLLGGKPSPVFTRTGLKSRKNIRVVTDLFADTDHSKYYMFDRRNVVFGGMNIADEYHEKWHDYMVLLRGETWAEAFENKVLKSSPWPESSQMVLAVNDAGQTEIRTAMAQIIDKAKDSVTIEHAYFSDDKIIEAVERAAQRGVNVRLILPEKPDTHLFANMATIDRLLALKSDNVPAIYLYPRMSHAKVIMTDGRIAAIGSANLTPRSMLTSKELTLFVHGAPDTAFIRKLREQLESDIAASRKVENPFHLGFLDRVKAFVGKYVW